MFINCVNRVIAAIVVCLSANALNAETLIEDGGVAISLAEFQAAVENMPPSVRQRLADDLGERLEVVNGMLVARKLAAEADALAPEDDGYWELQSKIIAAKYDFMFQRLQSQRSEPDLEPIARELYRVNKDKYALVPEVRASSHILLRSPPGLDRTEVRKKANAILEELRAGANFEEMVEIHSQDPGSKKRQGSLGRYIRFGDPKITPPYSEALFEIDEVGGYSEVTDSQFGVHIIRLDAIQPSAYAEFDQVKDAIIADVRSEFTTLANKELRARYNITDNLKIDGPKMEEVFAPYADNADE